VGIPKMAVVCYWKIDARTLSCKELGLSCFDAASSIGDTKKRIWPRAAALAKKDLCENLAFANVCGISEK
jgi:hypothetical protein